MQPSLNCGQLLRAQICSGTVRSGRGILVCQKCKKRRRDAFQIWLFSCNFGAGDEIRTHDPNLGKVVLYP